MTIDFFPFFKIAPLFLIALASPGPDFVVVSSLSLSRGRIAGLQGALGVSCGITLYLMATIWGLTALFEQIYGLMLAIKILGGIYLCYLGASLWRSTLKSAPQNNESMPTQPTNQKNAYFTGFITNLTNPKAIAFFSSVFALVLTPNINLETKIATTLLSAMMAMLWFSFVAIALSMPRIKTKYEQIHKSIDRVAGTLILLFGIKLVLSVLE